MAFGAVLETFGKYPQIGDIEGVRDISLKSGDIQKVSRYVQIKGICRKFP
jgi:hypothetical protein